MPLKNETTARGIILSAYPQGEHGRRLTLLTDRFGRITAFAGGAAKASSKLIGSLRPLTAASFTLAKGRSAWNIHTVDIIDAFTGLLAELEAYAYASYVLELAEYMSFEGMEEREAKFLLNLIFVTLSALRDNIITEERPVRHSAAASSDSAAEEGSEAARSKLNDGTGSAVRRLTAVSICSIYELKLLVMQGEYTETPGHIPAADKPESGLMEKNARLWRAIIKSPLSYMFKTALAEDEETLSLFNECVSVLFKKQVSHTFRSLLVLQQSGI